jgi:16S rRNA (uracil1498-N3)-methyltransferase
MTAPVFWCDRSALLAGDLVVVDGDEGRHAATVRRLAAGEPVVLVDGTGLLVQGVVAEVGKGRVEVAVVSRTETEPPAPRLVAVQALPKGDRGQVAVETLTEVGVDVVVPWAAERCVTQWRGERAEKSLERWRTTAREAAKQSRRAWFPEVPGLASTADVVERLRTAALAVVLHESATEPLATVDVPAAGDVVLVVGPEGGLSDAEVAAFGAVGAVAYRLGPTVLRTSTAGTAAAALLLGRSLRWR